jgi:thioredoxin 1
MANKLASLGEGDFEAQRLARRGFWLVELGATWCPACRSMEPALRSLAADLDGSVGFGAIDVDQQPGLADRFDVTHLPTMILFKDGEPIARQVGGMSRRDLLWLLQAAMYENHRSAA